MSVSLSEPITQWKRFRNVSERYGLFLCCMHIFNQNEMPYRFKF